MTRKKIVSFSVRSLIVPIGFAAACAAIVILPLAFGNYQPIPPHPATTTPTHTPTSSIGTPSTIGSNPNSTVQDCVVWLAQFHVVNLSGCEYAYSVETQKQFNLDYPKK